MLQAARRLNRRSYFKGRDRLVAGLLRVGGEIRLNVGGFTYCLNPRDNIARGIAVRGALPTEITPVLGELAEPGMTAIDVGASIGYTTMTMARAVGRHGRVFAFEPAALAYVQLCRNLTENGFSWVDAKRLACSHTSGTADLNVPLLSTEYSSLAASGRDLASRPESVQVVRLDEQLTGPIDLIKVDVEGAEWAVLLGLGELLSSRPILVVETIAENSVPFGYRYDEMLDWLRGFGYRIEQLTPDDVICR